MVVVTGRTSVVVTVSPSACTVVHEKRKSPGTGHTQQMPTSCTFNSCPCTQCCFLGFILS